ncbi:hypothetical protein TKK_0006629 [Trichogramma kaykai]
MIKHRHKKNNDAGTLVRGVGGGNVSARSRSDLHRSQKNQQQQQQYPPQVVRRRKLRGRSVSRSWPGTPNTQSIVSTTSSEIDYPEVHSGRMHRPPQAHPISDHRQVNLVFEDTVSRSFSFSADEALLSSLARSARLTPYVRVCVCLLT